MNHAARRLRLNKTSSPLPCRLRVVVAEGPAAPPRLSRKVSLVGESGLAQHVKESGAVGLAQLGQPDDVQAALAATLLWPALPQGKLDLPGVTESAKPAEVEPAPALPDAPP
jgi:hypothetical protein